MLKVIMMWSIVKLSNLNLGWFIFINFISPSSFHPSLPLCLLLSVYMCVCHTSVWMFEYQVCVETRIGLLEFLELELQTVVIYLMWMLGTELNALEARSAFNGWALFLALQNILNIFLLINKSLMFRLVSSILEIYS